MPCSSSTACFAFRAEINDRWDFRGWLDIGADLSIQRGTARDQDWTDSDAEALHLDRYLGAERVHIAEADPMRVADVVIDNRVLEHAHVRRRTPACGHPDARQARCRTGCGASPR
ncbi:hypothetical protein [Actinoalloteichus caeruleus]|uniref:hypothetical protein n=1 Tax=Actinoalloteichus cyanogriseus TaxID=2893586 RepID=UPI000A807214|nr:hypothetical protein [Actinoalloteichus caeruleus]